MSTKGYIRELERAKELARKAGQVILHIYQSDFKVTQKSDQSPVTQADLQSNDIIVSGLRLSFPDDAILTEEQEDDLNRLSSQRVWIIDPLDGTKEFIKRNGQFAISIGLVVHNKPVLGVIYAPARDELYCAAQGHGAMFEHAGLNSVLKVSSRSKLSEATLVRSGGSTDQRILRFDSLVNSTISIGSALKGCLVAKSDADIYARFECLWEWDVCAIHSIVEVAGGCVTSLDGSMISYNNENPRLPHGFVMSNSSLHHQALEVMSHG